MRCKHCSWDIHPTLDAFCGGCGDTLVGGRVVAPLPKDGQALDLAVGRSLRVQVEALGQSPWRPEAGLEGGDGWSWAWDDGESHDQGLAAGQVAWLRVQGPEDLALGAVHNLEWRSNGAPLPLKVRVVEPRAWLVGVAGELGQLVGSAPLHLPLRKEQGSKSWNLSLVASSGAYEVAEVHLQASSAGQWRLLPANPGDGGQVALRLEALALPEPMPAEGVLLTWRVVGAGGESEELELRVLPALPLPVQVAWQEKFMDGSALTTGLHMPLRLTLRLELEKGFQGNISFDAPTLPHAALALAQNWAPFSLNSLNASKDTQARRDLAFFLHPEALEAMSPTKRVGDVRTYIMQVTLPCRRGESSLSEWLRVDVVVELKEPEWVDFLAIDFGTSNTCMAYMNDGMAPRDVAPIFLPVTPKKGALVNYLRAEGEDLAKLLWNRSSTELAQTGAQQLATELYMNAVEGKSDTGLPLLFELGSHSDRKFEDAGRRVFAWKRHLGQGQTQPLFGDSQGRVPMVSPDHLTNWFLQALVQAFQQKEGKRARNLVLTRPVRWPKAALAAMEGAAKAMGFEHVITKVTEPEAVVFDFLLRATNAERLAWFPSDKNSLIGVFDFGGGTTDLAVLEYQPVSGGDLGNLKLLKSSGLNDLGGEVLSYELALALDRELRAVAPKMGLDLSLVPAMPADLDKYQRVDPRDLVQTYASKMLELAELVKVNYGKLDVKRDAVDSIAKSGGVRGLQDASVWHESPQLGGQLQVLADSKLSFHKVIKALTEASASVDKVGKANISWRLHLTTVFVNKTIEQKIKEGINRLGTISYECYTDNLTNSTKPDLVILSGNSSKLPALPAWAVKEFEMEPAQVLVVSEPKECVARGAACWSWLVMQGRYSDEEIEAEPELPLPEGLVVNAGMKEGLLQVLPPSSKAGEVGLSPPLLRRSSFQKSLNLMAEMGGTKWTDDGPKPALRRWASLSIEAVPLEQPYRLRVVSRGASGPVAYQLLPDAPEALPFAEGDLPDLEA